MTHGDTVLFCRMLQLLGLASATKSDLLGNAGSGQVASANLRPCSGHGGDFQIDARCVDAKPSCAFPIWLMMVGSLVRLSFDPKVVIDRSYLTVARGLQVDAER
jgi:hypothetical protein